MSTIPHVKSTSKNRVKLSAKDERNKKLFKLKLISANRF